MRVYFKTLHNHAHIVCQFISGSHEIYEKNSVWRITDHVCPASILKDVEVKYYKKTIHKRIEETLAYYSFPLYIMINLIFLIIHKFV